jgi:hypothetical protein
MSSTSGALSPIASIHPPFSSDGSPVGDTIYTQEGRRREGGGERREEGERRVGVCEVRRVWRGGWRGGIEDVPQ